VWKICLCFLFVFMRNLCFPNADFLLFPMGDGHHFIIRISYSDINPNSSGKSFFLLFQQQTNSVFVLYHRTEGRWYAKCPLSCFYLNQKLEQSSSQPHHKKSIWRRVTTRGGSSLTDISRTTTALALIFTVSKFIFLLPKFLKRLPYYHFSVS
jgi:hypothetical protein